MAGDAIVLGLGVLVVAEVAIAFFAVVFGDVRILRFDGGGGIGEFAGIMAAHAAGGGDILGGGRVVVALDAGDSGELVEVEERHFGAQRSRAGLFMTGAAVGEGEFKGAGMAFGKDLSDAVACGTVSGFGGDELFGGGQGRQGNGDGEEKQERKYPGRASDRFQHKVRSLRKEMAGSE